MRTGTKRQKVRSSHIFSGSLFCRPASSRHRAQPPSARCSALLGTARLPPCEPRPERERQQPGPGWPCLSRDAGEALQRSLPTSTARNSVILLQLLPYFFSPFPQPSGSLPSLLTGAERAVFAPSLLPCFLLAVRWLPASVAMASPFVIAHLGDREGEK